MNSKILIYGALGYTAKLFTLNAIKNKLPVVLGGRNEDLRTYAASLNVEARVFSLDDLSEIIANLQDIILIINLVGPFSSTSRQIIQACVRKKIHYIDIASEYVDFESIYGFDEQARIAGIMLMPGAAFGIAATDIAALLAVDKLPDAISLQISFASEGGVSRGTLKTILAYIEKEGVKLVNSKVVKALPASEVIFQKTLDGKTFSMYLNPWRADIFAAQFTTKVPNITAYSFFPGIIVSFMKGKLLWLRDFLLNRIVKILPAGPGEKQLSKGKTFSWATVKNNLNKEVTAIVEGPDPYLFTSNILVNISQEILKNNFKPGYQPPSIYGKELIEDIEGVRIGFLEA